MHVYIHIYVYIYIYIYLYTHINEPVYIHIRRREQSTGNVIANIGCTIIFNLVGEIVNIYIYIYTYMAIKRGGSTNT